jgi:hypothetical protein
MMDIESRSTPASTLGMLLRTYAEIGLRGVYLVFNDDAKEPGKCLGSESNGLI